MEGAQELSAGKDRKVVVLVAARAGVNAEGTVHFQAGLSHEVAHRFLPRTIPFFSQLDLDGHDMGRLVGLALAGLDDEIHLDPGGGAVIGQGTVLAADLVVNAQFVEDQGMPAAPTPPAAPGFSRYFLFEACPGTGYSPDMKTVRDYLQRWAEGQPFRPFVLRLEDGRAIPVTRLAHVACSDAGETIAVFLPDGTLEIIAQKSVASLQESRA